MLLVKRLMKSGYIIYSVVLLTYILLPNPNFPLPPLDSLQSKEPADSETQLRHAYFTDFTREEALLHYQKQFEKSSLFNIILPTYRLNYPPEEAGAIIRDQTRSTFLEEIVHPFRESVFINGFEPSQEKDVIFIEGKKWRQKITVRFVPSNTVIRLIITVLAIVFIPLLYKSWSLAVGDLRKTFKLLWTFR